MPEKWPTRKVDQSLDTIDSIDYRRVENYDLWSFRNFRLNQTYRSLYTDDFSGNKKLGTGLNFRPDAPDEKMYATFLKHEVKYVRQFSNTGFSLARSIWKSLEDLCWMLIAYKL